MSREMGNDGGYEMVGITMFHQLHCLSMIRSALQNKKMGLEIEGQEGGLVAGTDRRRSDDMGGEDLFGVRRRKRSVERGENGDLFGSRPKSRVDSNEDLFGVRRKKRREESHEGAPEHYLHCFDYLLQVGCIHKFW